MSIEAIASTQLDSFVDEVNIIAVGVVFNPQGEALLAKMDDEAHNQLAGQWHFPGAFVWGYMEMVHELRSYFKKVFELDVVFQRYIATKQRETLTGDERGARFVTTYWLLGRTEDGSRKITPNHHGEYPKVIEAGWFTKHQVVEKLHGTTSYDRTPFEAFRAFPD